MNPDPTSLDNLHDVVAPAPVSFWPPAPAWYWLIAAVALLAMIFLTRLIVHWLHNRYRYEALAELARQEAALSKMDSRASAITSIAELLKRTALSAFPREKVAALTGAQWLAFLDKTGRTTEFSNGPGAWLARIAYNPSEISDMDENQMQSLVKTARHWIQHHHVEMEGAA